MGVIEKDQTKPTIIQIHLSNLYVVSHPMEEFQNKVIIMTTFNLSDNNQEMQNILLVIGNLNYTVYKRTNKADKLYQVFQDPSSIE
jgi:hypothetical protein|tara:strand:+ start:278 stop:535 length:258 start_codon:yes stop_codon:yes gene_type:complete